MNYKLAIELKNAGFPQGDSHLVKEVIPLAMHGVLTPAISPTLSELIEACGDTFFAELSLLHYEKDGDSWNNWIASATTIVPIVGSGSTPEEAVARLWLALNKK